MFFKKKCIFNTGVLAIKDDTPEIATTLSWDVLLEPKKLWGFYKHSSAQIRKSLYHFLAVFARHQPAALLAPYLASIFPILFSFGERDISALADLWEAILLITKGIFFYFLISTRTFQL